MIATRCQSLSSGMRRMSSGGCDSGSMQRQRTSWRATFCSRGNPRVMKRRFTTDVAVAEEERLAEHADVDAANLSVVVVEH